LLETKNIDADEIYTIWDDSTSYLSDLSFGAKAMSKRASRSTIGPIEFIDRVIKRVEIHCWDKAQSESTASL
jgi:hypothetical protein